jgi:ABC-2 type transport system ATP-binding protein
MENDGAVAPIVALRGLTKRYGKVEALRGLDLRLGAGEVYGFLGRNGAGKSTALRIIMGITRPSEGEVALFGRALRGEDAGVRRRIGYVAQEQSFYGWMTPAGLGRFVSGFYPTWDGAEYDRLLRILELPTDRRVDGFSGGMTAKLALALALAHRPELLILDEPTAGMDAVGRREFLGLVREQAQRTGRATLFSSHLIDEVELAADTIGIVDGGRMLWEGRPDALLAQVRCLRHTGPPESAPPPPTFGEASGLTIVDDHVEGGARTLTIRARDPALLELLPAAAPGWEIGAPSLEDTFVALVRRRMAY